MNRLLEVTPSLSLHGVATVVFLWCSPLIILMYALGTYSANTEGFATMILMPGISSRQAAEIQTKVAETTSVARAELLSSKDAADLLKIKSKTELSKMGVDPASLPQRIRIVPQYGFTFENIATDMQKIILNPAVSTFAIPEKYNRLFAPIAIAFWSSLFLFFLALPLIWFVILKDLRQYFEGNKRRIQLMEIFGYPAFTLRSREMMRGIKEGLIIGIYATFILFIAVVAGHIIFPDLGYAFRGSMLIWGIVIVPLGSLPLGMVAARRVALKELQ